MLHKKMSDVNHLAQILIVIVRIAVVAMMAQVPLMSKSQFYGILSAGVCVSEYFYNMVL